MEKIRVVEVERYRDGGTIVYEDELNRRYFMWWPTRKIYNQMPFPRGNVGTGDVPPSAYVKEIPVELEILTTFQII